MRPHFPDATDFMNKFARQVTFEGGSYPAHRFEPLADKKPGTLVVHEVYRSVQGESTFAGLPCVFVRLTACNLRCRWCDSPHAFVEGAPQPVDTIVRRVLDDPTPLVEVTGGEPLLQPEVHPLMAALADAGRTVLVETGGSLSIEPVDPRVRVILDLKCPGSRECDRNDLANLDRLRPGDELKFVLADRTDFDWARDRLLEWGRGSEFPVHFSPVFGELDPRILAEWILDSGLPVRLQLQLHKHVWDPDARGV